MANNRYCVDYAKLGTSSCKKCKQKIEKGSLRIGKIVPNPFTDGGGDMKQWHHVPCIFDLLSRARATTKKIDEPEDLEGWDAIQKGDKDEILRFIKDQPASSKTTKKSPGKGKNEKQKSRSPSPDQPASSKTAKRSPGKGKNEKQKSRSPSPAGLNPVNPGDTKDDSFREFRRLCANIAEEPSYTGKTKIVSDFLSGGCSRKSFQGDTYLWIKMLLPGIAKRIYNLQSKQLVKLFSVIFDTSQEEMIEDLEQGDVAETIRVFFEQSETFSPTKKSTLMLQEVEDFLNELSTLTKEENQIYLLKKITKRCTSNDLKMIIRLIKHDLRINAGAKHILDGLNPTAYQAFQVSRNLKDVVSRALKQIKAGNMNRELSIKASLMTPILPMLAEPCRSVDYAFKKCPNGMYAEIKYDGERVQVHKNGNIFNYFSRSLKPVLPHKVAHLKDFIPKAFPNANDLILDSEILMMDTNTGKPLPFGTLGVHKKAAFKDATVCLFVFDCIHINGQNLLDKSISYRRKIMQKNMKEIPNHVMFSDMKEVKGKDHLKKMILSAIEEGLEGLIIKDKESIYEPGKRHWLKVKKDYLEKGAMADSADLVVLGAYFGTGNKGGMMSIFLMGCFDPTTKKWYTVTKVSGGHDDSTLAKLQKELDMVKISKNPSKVPPWLIVNKSLIPDFICRDPKESHVWEITGAEFTKAEVHTARGISIRFPRVTSIRDDKSWKEATNLQELQKLFKKSRGSSDIKELSSSLKSSDMTNDSDSDDSEKPNKEKKNTKVEKRKLSSPMRTPQKKAKFCGQSTSQNGFRVNLPDVFSGMKLLLPPSVDKYDTLHRYIVAYDGDLVHEDASDDATHAVVTNANEWNRPESFTGSVVSLDWLWYCIRQQKLLPTSQIPPTVNSVA